MSEVIDFLEMVGQDARLRHAGVSGVAAALAGTGIAPAERAALLAGDSRRLEALLGAQTNVCCIIAPGKEEEDDEDESEEDDEDDEEVRAYVT